MSTFCVVQCGEEIGRADGKEHCFRFGSEISNTHIYYCLFKPPQMLRCFKIRFFFLFQQTVQIMVSVFNIGLGPGRTSTGSGDLTSLGVAYWLGAVVKNK